MHDLILTVVTVFGTIYVSRILWTWFTIWPSHVRMKQEFIKSCCIVLVLFIIISLNACGKVAEDTDAFESSPDLSASPQLKICYNFGHEQNAEKGQCAGANGVQCAPVGEWTPSLLIDTDSRDGGCLQQFALVKDNPTEEESNLELCVNVFPEEGSQCKSAGIHCAYLNEWTDPHLIDTDSRSGGCLQQFRITNPNSNYTFEVEYKGPDNGGDPHQCGHETSDPVVYNSLNNQWTSYLRLDTDNRPGGCSQKFRIQRGEPLPPPPSGAGEIYPTIFVHGHGNDTWAWETMIHRVKGLRQTYRNARGFYAGDEISGAYDKNSVWNFGYYRETASQTEQYPYIGKIGGIPTQRKIKVYPLQGTNYNVSRCACRLLQNMGGRCNPDLQPLEVVDEQYQQRTSYAHQLKRAVDKILAATGATKVNVVTHSMGGIVARSYIKWLGGAQKVNKLLTVATANNGIPDISEHIMQYGLMCFGLGQHEDTMWMRLNEDLEQYAKTVDEYHMDQCQEYLPLYDGKSFIQQLNDGGVAIPPVKYATIAGDFHDVSLPYGLLGETCVNWIRSHGVPAYPCDDVAVNVADVQINYPDVINWIVNAAHGRPENGEPLLGIGDSNKLLTESERVAKIIRSWLWDESVGSLAVEPPSDFDQDGVADKDDSDDDNDGIRDQYDPNPTNQNNRLKIPLVLEDGENISDWANIWNDLDVATVSSKAITGSGSMQIGGSDEGWTWVGAIEKTLNSLPNITGLAPVPENIQFWATRGGTLRGGRPSLTIKLYDVTNAELILSRPEDQILPWQGGGERTIVSNYGWQPYSYQIVGTSLANAHFNWSSLKKIRIEVRKSILNNGGQWQNDQEPDDVSLDELKITYTLNWRDGDNDGLHDLTDNCPQIANSNQSDSDADGLGNVCDNCPRDSNPRQEDLNRNNVGDACERHVDILLEDCEDISDLINQNGDLNTFAVSTESKVGSCSCNLGGDEELASWIGAVSKNITDNDWTESNIIKIWAKKSGTSTANSPSITFLAEDDLGNKIELHRDEDIFLPWSGGGWRTLIDNTDWELLLLPIRHEQSISWSNIRSFRIELRRSIVKDDERWRWLDVPGNILIDEIILDPPIGPETPPGDRDEDGIVDEYDNCPGTSNSNQSDINFNEIGDACEIISPPKPPAPNLRPTSVSQDDSFYYFEISNLGEITLPQNQTFYVCYEWQPFSNTSNLGYYNFNCTRIEHPAMPVSATHVVRVQKTDGGKISKFIVDVYDEISETNESDNELIVN